LIDIQRKVKEFSKKLPLSPSTVFFALNLAGSVIRILRVTRRISQEDFIGLTYGSLFLAAKFRERDINCPLIPHMVQFSGKCSN